MNGMREVFLSLWSLAVSRSLAGGLALLMAVAVSGIEAQVASRSAVVVDYIGAEGLYLAVGSGQGVQAGDTLTLFEQVESAQPLGRVVVESVSSRRSVATVLGPEFVIAAGTVVYTVLPDRSESTLPERAAPGAVPQGPTRPSAGAGAGRTRPRVRGHFSLDLDVRETRTSWGGSGLPTGETTRRFATPTSRLTLRATNLPGGWRLSANVRGSYRYSDGPGIASPSSLRLYDLSATKEFTEVPIEIRIGRFYNPFESYSSYWDGGMVRVGGDGGAGLGIAAGFQPDRSSEGLSGDVPKVTGFADYSIRRPDWRYRTDISLHILRPKAEDLLDRTFGGWSQRLTVKRVSFDQKLQVDRNPETGSWTLARLRLRASVALEDRVRIHAGVVRRKASFLRQDDLLSDSQRDEGNVGLSVMGEAGSLSANIGSTGWSGEERGTALSGSAAYRLGGAQLHGSGRWWSRAGSSSLSLAPGLSFRWRSFRTRLGYQYYETKGLTTLVSHAGDASVTSSLAGGWRITVRLRQQWGRTFSGSYLRTGISRSF